jgi:CRISPR-associated protein Cmr3
MSRLPFTTLVLLEPLGWLHGSSGRVLSPESLTGRAVEHFPPDAPALSGVLASQLGPREQHHLELFTAGPFWMQPNGELMVPAPMVLVQEAANTSVSPATASERRSRRLLAWQPASDDQPGAWLDPDPPSTEAKQPSGGWIRLADWPRPEAPVPPEGIPIHDDPWQAIPHLHPRLQEHERVSAKENALFLEYGIALAPGVRLAYLSSHPVADGVVRFGGEGHLALLECHPIPPLLLHLLQAPLQAPFALITPGVWGGPKLSIREPIDTSVPRGHFPWQRGGLAPGILTERPRPWRYRLGPGPTGKRRLSRGRWALPPGTCYQVAGDPLPPWFDWPESWFPKEGFFFRHFGTALSLPIPAP